MERRIRRRGRGGVGGGGEGAEVVVDGKKEDRGMRLSRRSRPAAEVERRRTGGVR